MGRPKKDYSKNECSVCKKRGTQLRRSMCGTCYMREHHRKSFAYLETYREARRENAKQWNRANRERHSANKFRHTLEKTYGITLAFYEELRAKPNNVCALCAKPPSGRCKRLSIDHDHATGRVRGLVCIPCNFLIGHLETFPPDVIEKAWLYLAEHELKGELNQ